MDPIELLAKERRARMAAERLLEQKQAELSAANRTLSLHALSLSDEIVEKREESEALKTETEQVRTELETANTAAEVAERRLWDSVQTIQDGFAVFDAEEKLVSANAAYLKPFEDLENVVPGVKYEELLTLAAEEGIVDIGDHSRADWIEQMLWRWRGQKIAPFVTRLWDGTSVKFIDKRSNDGDTVSLALNITDTIRNEAKLKTARRRAEAANRAKSAFLANMSHEIRTPMNGVVGIADLLFETELNEEQQLYVETIKSSGEALLVLINDVLDYSKIEAEKLTIRPEEFDLERCIYEVAAMMQPSVREKKLELLVDYDMFLPTGFIADPGRIRQVLINLIGNAIKFTEEGHVLVRVVGMPSPENDATQTLHVSIEDTGIGIPEEKLGHIFGEFNQVEDERNRRFEGTGLGLSISKRLIDLMGGKIWVESKVGQGTCIGFNIRLEVADSAESSELNMPSWVRRIFIVDPKLVNRQLLEKQLNTTETETVLVPAFRDLKEHAVASNDVVLVDIELVDATALLELHALRATPICARVLVMANGTLPDEIAACSDGIVQKPCRRSDMSLALSGLTQVEVEPVANVAQQSSEPASEELANEDQRAMRILAADDNKTNRLVFSKLVKSLDIELVFAVDGRQAVELFQSVRPDLIFMDISMPEVDGKEATRQIRALEAVHGLKHTTIVALTAHAMDGDDLGILAAGLDHYLTKPFQKDAILSRIEKEQPDECRPIRSEQAA